MGSRVAQVLNIAFDMGAWEILGCLMNGGTLYIRGSDWKATISQVRSLQELAIAIQSTNLVAGGHTYMHTVYSIQVSTAGIPGHQICRNWRRTLFPSVSVHSKKLPVTTTNPFFSLADEWAEDACFYNICGPTEVTILNSAHRHTPGQPLSIGKPLPNTTCYILDENEQPVPSGQKGTMWVGGAGVTRGYINLPELTSRRYKPDKFLENG